MKYKIRYIEPDVDGHDMPVGDRIRLIFVRDGVEVDQIDMMRDRNGAVEVVEEIRYSESSGEHDGYTQTTTEQR